MPEITDRKKRVGLQLPVDVSGLEVGGAPFSVYTPLMQVKTDLLRAKLIETPWLGFVNHMSMVASKAARVVHAANGKSVMEFGQRRTHPAAGLDAAWAAWVAGISATSNVAAFARWRITTTGTMDHFAIQASERAGVSRAESERTRVSASFLTKACGRLMTPIKVSFIAMSDWIWLVPS